MIVTSEQREKILAAWDASVALGEARRRALFDTTVTVAEYIALSRSESLANMSFVDLCGGYSQATLPSLTAWPDAR